MQAYKFYMWQNRMCISYLLRFNQIKRFLTANGWEYTDNMEEADYCIVGACGAFLPDFEKYKNKVAEISSLQAKLIIFGCLPVIDRAFYKKSTPDEALFIHARKPEKIESIVENPSVSWSEIDTDGKFRAQDYVHQIPNRSYILIQEGCNEGCVYCPHWISIGRERSRPLEQIVEQVRLAYENGDREFVLEGNNAGSWGLDFDPPRTYPEMLQSVLNATGDSRIIIGDFAPKWVVRYGESLINRRIVDLKIPIQTTSSSVLKVLGRTPEVKQISPVLKAIKKQFPDTILRTEIIIGLPTSTIDELYDTLDFVIEHFDKVSCFSFDLHPSAKIARMDIPLHSEEEIEKHILKAIDYVTGKDIIAAFDDRGYVCNKVTQKISEAD